MTLNVRGVIVGDSNTGKSAIMQRLCGREFPVDSHATVGIDVMGVKVGGFRIVLQDAAGDVRFQTAIGSYMRNIAFCIIVYDIEHTASLQRAIDWFVHIKTLNTNEHLIMYLFANKQDVPVHYVDSEEGNMVANAWGATFVQTSAKTNQGLTDFFDGLLREIDLVLPRIDMTDKKYGIRREIVENQREFCWCVVT